jgi:hypothetical protein
MDRKLAKTLVPFTITQAGTQDGILLHRRQIKLLDLVQRKTGYLHGFQSDEVDVK